MNEFLRVFVLTTIMKMIENNKPEWEVRKYALDWYSKGILTEEDLQEIDNRYKQPEPVEEAVEEAVENLADNTEVDSTEQIEENSAETVEDTAENVEESEE